MLSYSTSLSLLFVFYNNLDLIKWIQVALLKEEVRNVERMQKREGVDMTYLKNVVLKLLETGITYYWS